MSSPHASKNDSSVYEEPEGVAALAGAAVVGLMLALGFVALTARVGGPNPVEASVQPPAATVAPAVTPEQDNGPSIPSLYDETGAH